MAPLYRKKIAVISNPVSGNEVKRRILYPVIEELKNKGIEIEHFVSERPNGAGEFVSTIINSKFDAVAVAGGDGTICEVANALIGSNIPMALIPTGTINLLARELGLTRDAEDLAKTIAKGPVRQIFPCYAGNRLFLVLASVGFDANVVNDVSLSLKYKLGLWAYVLSFITRWLTSPCSPMEIEINGEERTVSGIVVANGRYYAGPFYIVKNASVFVPNFHLCLFSGTSRWSLLTLFATIVLGKANVLHKLEVILSSSLTVVGPPGLPVQVDGDVVGRTPITITRSEENLHLIVPV